MGHCSPLLGGELFKDTTMQFKEREDVDPFFYDPDAEAEYFAEKYHEEIERQHEEWKDRQIEKAMNPEK